ncbi:MAG: PAS domain S-box protein [Elusimicrobia bacterium]|nr:PAS domain S-box protein [Elusimicrobiota bacterium]
MKKGRTGLNKNYREAVSLLKDKEKLLDTVMASMGDGLSIQDLDMRIVYQNKFMIDNFGKHTGEYCYAIYERRDKICEGCPIREAYKDGKVHKALRIGITGDGTPFRFENIASVLTNEKGKIVAGMELCRIVEEREKVKEELQSSEKRFKDFIFSVADWVWEVDRNGVYKYCSEQVKNILGYEVNEILGKTPFDFMLPEEAERIGKIFSEIVKKKLSVKDLENWNLNKEGKRICLLTNGVPVLDEKGNIIGYRGVDKDITERKNAEESLKESEERFRSIFDNVTDGILLADLKSKKFYTGNNMICRMLGYNLEEIKELGVNDIHPEKDLPYVVEQFQKQARGKIVLAKDIPVKRKDGSVFYADVNSSPVVLKGEQYLLGIFRDITERKKAEDEKEKFQAQIMQSGKLAAVGQLAGGVAHEINNPMGVILGFSQSVVRMVKEDNPLYMPLKSIEREAIRCKKLIVDLLTFSRTAKTEAEVIDINAAIDGTLSLIEAQAKVKNVEITREYGKDIPQIKANKNQIQQVIMNLCSNAIDAMPGGGKLAVITRIVKGPKSGVQNSKSKDQRDLTLDYIEISVSDTGEGIPKENQEKIFDAFFTTKEVGKGTGLGLSLCYEIIQKHNGTIKIESPVTRDGKGTTFTIKLPL